MATLIPPYNDIPPYYQGSTIAFYIQGNDIVNFDDINFKVGIYTGQITPTIFQKSDFTFISANKYYIEIDKEDTKTMPTGLYFMEIMIGTNYTSIGVTNKNGSFNLFPSKIGVL